MSGERLDRASFLATLPRRRIGAGALIRDEAGRVLLVEPTYRPDWLLPGGTVEADESPSTACRREVLEELGLDRPLGRLLVINSNRPDPPTDPYGSLQFGYDGGVLTEPEIAAIRLPADELRSYAFVEVDRIGDRLGPRSRPLVTAGLAALADGTLHELE
ncbi:NUDIX hydrolase [Microlunatus parietis]|uniref:8-oxo-dGTP pyrophosphatase MutT (NUDIX family) n=1 Tax=Microlunatus parietis TaxID=682979 RepID=A0A7Y9IDI1_9ACTN|nr:NUDIX hydrolase [Microlunatus parietis]NYE74951.1 8-oxo-dGTP pyrophosphatase MutT (NUDIX family) [Microlunatus parietis]